MPFLLLISFLLLKGNTNEVILRQPETLILTNKTDYIKSLPLGAGNVLHADVLQCGIDVLLEVKESNGNILVSQNFYNKNEESEHLQWVIPADGTYRFCIRAIDNGDVEGTVELSLAVKPKADDFDHEFEFASEWFRLALSGNGLGKEERSTLFLSAAKIFWSQGYSDLARISYYKAGLEQYRLGNLEKALEFHNLALRSLLLPDRAQRAITLFTVKGVFLRHLGQPHAALRSYEQAMEWAKREQNLLMVARIHSNIGIVLHLLSRDEEAIRHFQEAGTFFASGDFQGFAARTLNNYAVSLMDLYEYDLAEEKLQNALTLLEQNPDEQIELYTLTHLSDLYQRKGQHDLAREYLSKAVDRVKDSSDKGALVNLQNNLGYSYLLSGEFEKVIALEEHAFQLCQSVNDQRGAMFSRFIKGIALLKKGEFSLAEDHLGQALSMAMDLSDLELVSGLHFQLARLYQKTGDLSLALTHVESAMNLLSHKRRKLNSPVFRSLMWQNSQEVFDLHLNLLAEQYLASSDDETARRMYTTFETMRARALWDRIVQSGAELRTNVNKDKVYQRQELLGKIEQNDMERIAAVERGLPTSQIEKKLEANLVKLKEFDVSVLNPNVMTARKRWQPLSLHDLQTDGLDDRTTILILYPLDDKLLSWVITSDKFHLTITSLPKDLEPDISKALTLLKSGKYEEETYSVLGKLSTALIGPSLERLSTKRLVLITTGKLQQLPFAAFPLSKASNGVLLVDHFELVHAPSVSMSNQLRSRIPTFPYQIAIWADPVFDVNDYRLKVHPSKLLRQDQDRPMPNVFAFLDGAPYRDGGLNLDRLRSSRVEALAIHSLSGKGEQAKIYLDFQATKQSVLESRLEDFRILHFATHGIINDDHPELSGLVLSLVDERGEARDGFLRLQDIYNLRLKSELVVLSSCRSATGKQVRGEGMMGLSYGFLAAGAKGVLASLWDVSDSASSELMTQFYQSMMLGGKLDAPTSLQNAQIRLKQEKRYSHPKYWASFVYQGAW